MSETTGRIATRSARNGRVLVIGPAARILPALDGSPITIEMGPCEGDIVHIGAGYQDGEHGWAHYQIAESFEHPEYGTVVAAYIDESPTALAAAPKFRAIRGRRSAAVAAADARAQAEEDRLSSDE